MSGLPFSVTLNWARAGSCPSASPPEALSSGSAIRSLSMKPASWVRTCGGLPVGGIGRLPTTSVPFRIRRTPRPRASGMPSSIFLPSSVSAFAKVVPGSTTRGSSPGGAPESEGSDPSGLKPYGAASMPGRGSNSNPASRARNLIISSVFGAVIVFSARRFLAFAWTRSHASITHS